MIASSLCEEVHNFQKHNGQLRASTKFRKAERALAISWAKSLTSSRHHYGDVTPTMPIAKRSLKLDKDAFGKRSWPATVNSSRISSVQASPKAENTGLPEENAFMMREADLYTGGRRL